MWTYYAKFLSKFCKTKYNTFCSSHRTGPTIPHHFSFFFVPLFSSFRNVHPIIRLTDARPRFPDGNRRKLTSAKEVAIPMDPMSKQTPRKYFRGLLFPRAELVLGNFLVFSGKQEPNVALVPLYFALRFSDRIFPANYYFANVSLTATGR